MIISELTRQQMQIPVSWAAAEGWNPGLSDAECFFRTDPHGFIGGSLDGETIATISAVRYAQAFGFIGFYIVKSEFRGRGFGRQIWDFAMKRLQVPCVGLDGVVEQQDFYCKSGFVLAHRNIRYQGSADRQANLCTEIKRYQPKYFECLMAYDAIHFGFPRKSFLKSWLSQVNHTAIILHSANAIKGYGVIRKCLEGYKIGPLFADDYHSAKEIMQALLNSIPSGESFFLDIPEPNLFAQDLVEQYQMDKVFETARMYLGTAFSLPINQIFGISSFELG